MKNSFVHEYSREYANYQHCTNQARRLLMKLLNEQEFHIHMVSGRTKSCASLAEKIINRTANPLHIATYLGRN